jgi:hypothetical protein
VKKSNRRSREKSVRGPSPLQSSVILLGLGACLSPQLPVTLLTDSFIPCHLAGFAFRPHSRQPHGAHFHNSYTVVRLLVSTIILGVSQPVPSPPPTSASHNSCLYAEAVQIQWRNKPHFAPLVCSSSHLVQVTHHHPRAARALFCTIHDLFHSSRRSTIVYIAQSSRLESTRASSTLSHHPTAPSSSPAADRFALGSMF